MNARVWNSPVAAASRNVGNSAANVGIRKPSENTRSTSAPTRPSVRAMAKAAGIARASVSTSASTVTSIELRTAGPRCAEENDSVKLVVEREVGRENGLPKIWSFVLNAETSR